MGAVEERKALERLSQAWRKLTTGGKSPAPIGAPSEASPPAGSTPGSPQAAPGPISPPPA